MKREILVIPFAVLLAVLSIAVFVGDNKTDSILDSTWIETINLQLDAAKPFPDELPLEYGMNENVWLWQNGTEEYVTGPESELTQFLFQTLSRVNAVENRTLTDEEAERIKENNVAVKLRLRYVSSRNIVTAKLVQPQLRDGILTNEEGYQVLKLLTEVLFITMDNLNEDLEARILVRSEEDQTQQWSVWKITK